MRRGADVMHMRARESAARSSTRIRPLSRGVVYSYSSDLFEMGRVRAGVSE